MRKRNYPAVLLAVILSGSFILTTACESLESHLKYNNGDQSVEHDMKVTGKNDSKNLTIDPADEE